MNKEELIIYAIITSQALKEGKKQELIDYVSNLQQERDKYKEVIDKLKEWEQTHTILVYTKEAPRQLVGTHELLHLLYDKEVE